MIKVIKNQISDEYCIFQLLITLAAMHYALLNANFLSVSVNNKHFNKYHSVVLNLCKVVYLFTMTSLSGLGFLSSVKRNLLAQSSKGKTIYSFNIKMLF